jgi:hypothetical protein
MNVPAKNIKSIRFKTPVNILAVLLAVLALSFVAISFLRLSMKEEITAALLILSFLTGCVIAWITKKYYNWSIVFICLIIIAIIFRSQRWPLTGLLFSLGFTGLGCISIYSAVIFLKRYTHIPFLKYMGFTSSVILSVVSMGLLWKTVHWPFAGIVLNVALALFIPFLFAFIFMLPGSNYVKWESSDRIVFFRAMIIPMAFLYILCVMMFVFPDLWTSLTRLPLTPFYMHNIELLNKPGLF